MKSFWFEALVICYLFLLFLDSYNAQRKRGKIALGETQSLIDGFLFFSAPFLPSIILVNYRDGQWHQFEMVS